MPVKVKSKVTRKAKPSSSRSKSTTTVKSARGTTVKAKTKSTKNGKTTTTGITSNTKGKGKGSSKVMAWSDGKNVMGFKASDKPTAKQKAILKKYKASKKKK